jgi:ADP-ribose pyrophosphatase YjhB (NUDIX family)
MLREQPIRSFLTMTQREYPNAPLVGVGGVVVDEEGRVLVVRRGTEPLKGRWSIPGGLVELGETLKEAVEREVAEETGLRVESGAVIEVLNRIYRDSPDGVERVRYHYVVVDTVCRVIAGVAGPGSDADEVRWITRGEWQDANPLNLEELTRLVIEKGWQMARTAGEDAS